MKDLNVFLAKIALPLVIVALVASSAAAEQGDLENRIAELEARLDAIGEQQIQEAGKNPVWSSLDIQLYGYIKLDASYDSTPLFPGNFAIWALPDSATNKRNDSRFNMTANQTRIGLRLKGPQVGAAESGGVVETDFYGAGGNENTPNWRLRRAFVTLNWKELDLTLLAGQEWDLFSPLAPETLMFFPLGFAGNLGDRRPQVRLTKGLAVSDSAKLKLEGAVMRTIRNGENWGEASGYPGAASRISMAVDTPVGRPLVMGVSGHYASENTPASKNYKSWSVNTDLSIPVSKAVTLQAEAFTGENLNTYAGSIGKGVDTTLRTEVRSWGGWAGLGIRPATLPNWRFNVMTGIEDVNSDHLSAATDRRLNRVILGNVIRSFGKNFDVGLEVSEWTTKFKDAREANGYRIQCAFVYKF